MSKGICFQIQQSNYKDKLIFQIYLYQRIMLLQLTIIYLFTMETFIQEKIVNIQGKNYLQPKFSVEGYEQFFLPKLQLKGTEHVYFNTGDIMELYKQKNIDPENLECNLKYVPDKQPQLQPKKSERKDQQKSVAESQKDKAKNVEPVKLINNRYRPPLRETGPTHFIHIPFIDACKETFENIIKSQIDPNDQDSLVDVHTLHATIMVFRLRSYEDIPKWERIMKSIKLRKAKITMRGVGIFPIKVNTNYTRVLYIKVDGLDEIIHDIVSKAINDGLVNEKQLSFITFDKKTDMYRAGQQHLTILKTKSEKQFIDATQYLKTFSKLNLGRVPINDIRMSMVGSFDGEGYFDELVIPADH